MMRLLIALTAVVVSMAPLRAQDTDASGSVIIVPASVPVELTKAATSSNPVTVEIARTSIWDDFWKIVSPLLTALVAYGVVLVMRRTAKISDSNAVRAVERAEEKKTIVAEKTALDTTLADMAAVQQAVHGLVDGKMAVVLEHVSRLADTVAELNPTRRTAAEAKTARIVLEEHNESTAAAAKKIAEVKETAAAAVAPTVVIEAPATITVVASKEPTP